MTLSELYTALSNANVDPNTKIELSDGSTIDDLCYHEGQRRLCLSTMDDRIEADKLAKGWRYIFKY